MIRVGELRKRPPSPCDDHGSLDILVMALVKSGTPKEQYVFLWRYHQTDELLQRIGRMAANPELSLTWCDAAVLTKRAREMPTA